MRRNRNMPGGQEYVMNNIGFRVVVVVSVIRNEARANR
jgi:hypothetical protein